MDGQAIQRFVLEEWPTVGEFVRPKAARCDTCLLSERAVTITDGRCDLCLDYSPQPEKASRPLPYTFVSDGGQYDALIMVSGGKDSAWCVRKIQRTYPWLKMCAVTVDNGFSSRCGLDNSLRIVNQHGIDWQLLANSRNAAEPLREAFLLVGDRGCSHVVDHVDGDLIYKRAIEAAKSMGVNTIICGLSLDQIEQHLGHRNCTFETDGVTLVSPIAMWQPSQRTVVQDVLRWNLLEPDAISPLITNSDLIIPEFVVDHRRLGYSSFEWEFARGIREGRADRDMWLSPFEAIEYLCTSGRLDVKADEVLSRLGLRLKDVV